VLRRLNYALEKTMGKVLVTEHKLKEKGLANRHEQLCRWNPKTDQLARWMGVAPLRARKGFRRVRGHKELGQLVSALERAGSAARSTKIEVE
jgi:hypothetical protein